VQYKTKNRGFHQMMSREQLLTLAMCTRRLCIFVPKDITKKIYHTAPDLDLNSEVAPLLKHIAYEPNPTKVKEMLDANPGLLMQSGDVVTAAGHTAIAIKPYECGLGEGDHYKDAQGFEMIPLIASYFSKIPGLTAEEGEQERVRQYARYQSAIENIPNQKPTESIAWIFEVIEKNADEKVLNDALETFRQDKALTPRFITRPGMHCNYANPQHALDVFAEKFEDLYKASGNNYRKCFLAWDKVVIYVMGGLSACERMRVAGGLKNISEPLVRTFNFKLGGGAFPARDPSHPPIGAGFDLIVDLYFGANCHSLGRGGSRVGAWAAARLFQNLCRAKTSDLQNLCSQPSNQMRAGV
jgi:hypothetical protein